MKVTKDERHNKQEGLELPDLHSEKAEGEPERKCFLPEAETTKSRFHEHRFQKVKGTQLFVVSAFLDDRNKTVVKVVRILGLAPYRQPNSHILCQLVCESGTITQENARIEVFPEKIPPFCKWKTTFVYSPVF